MTKRSAGILLYRLRDKQLEVFLVHMGGPFWNNKDEGAWTIPKGEFNETENALDAAKREFKEETGKEIEGNFIELNFIKQKNGKTVYAWAVEGDFDPAKIKSNIFEIEWPAKSGKLKTFPEIDRAEWFDTETARKKIIQAQSSFIDELEDNLK